MSLLDALLLDPPRIDVWVILRAFALGAGIKGSGTQSDPYSVLSAADFDGLMNDPTRIPPKPCVHLGPGVFLTQGYYEGISGSWQPKPGMRIVGSGIDITTIQRVNNTANKRSYAIGHDLVSGGLPNSVDFFEVCDLTIDCNLASFGTNTGSTAGAVRIMGNHSRVRRVKVKNWGAKSGASVGYVIAVLTGNTLATDPIEGQITGISDTGIQDCIAVEPDPLTDATASLVVLHAGAREALGASDCNGLNPYIRNCYVDGTLTPNSSPSINLNLNIRALSMSWCTGGVIEGNQLRNLKYGGPYQDSLGASQITVRNNGYRNVAAGPIWNLSASGVRNLLIEGNDIELTTSPITTISGTTPFGVYGVLIYDGAAIVNPHGNVAVRNNRIRYLNGIAPGSQTGAGILVAGATNLLTRENVVELAAVNPRISNWRCGSVDYLENRSPTGVLIQGIKREDGSAYSELSTDVEAAFIWSLLRSA